MKKILNGGYDFIIAKDKIIYGVIDYKSKKVNIYSTNMSGKSKKKIGTTRDWSKFFTYGDNLYFISGKKQYGNALYEACSQVFYKDTVIASKVDQNKNILGYKKVVKVD